MNQGLFANLGKRRGARGRGLLGVEGAEGSDRSLLLFRLSGGQVFTPQPSPSFSFPYLRAAMLSASYSRALHSFPAPFCSGFRRSLACLSLSWSVPGCGSALFLPSFSLSPLVPSSGRDLFLHHRIQRVEPPFPPVPRFKASGLSSAELLPAPSRRSFLPFPASAFPRSLPAFYGCSI